MEYYIGLDVSQRQTAICIIDDKGVKLAEGKALTLPSDIPTYMHNKLLRELGGNPWPTRFTGYGRFQSRHYAINIQPHF